MKENSGYVWKLGMFVALGLGILVIAIYLIGMQKNLFGNTFQLKTVFRSVSGLKVGNNVRFAGINIGTVDEIGLVTDSSVLVYLIIKDEAMPYLKLDSKASIGSDGLMGDKVLIIQPGTINAELVKNGSTIASSEAVEIQDIIASLKKSVDNATVITDQLAGFTYKMNNGKGALQKLISDEQFSESIKGTILHLEKSSKEFAQFTWKMNHGNGALSKLVSDEDFANELDSTMTNLKTGSKGLSENMEAAKSNFLLKGYFNKKKREETKRQAELIKQEELRQKKLMQKVKQPLLLKDSTG
jgi:phospholipid/cholesterol/gamma-HCH transport system substrate-binding protein